MKTKYLMTSSSFFLGAAGISALFMPDWVLSALGINVTEAGSLFVQLMGASNFSFALMNWTAKDSAIGGIYARPVSLANFCHFFIGTMLLVKYLTSVEFDLIVFFLTAVYAVYAACFYWLVFRASGLKQG